MSISPAETITLSMAMEVHQVHCLDALVFTSTVEELRTSKLVAADWIGDGLPYRIHLHATCRAKPSDAYAREQPPRQL
jgi:hypothetical protein